MAADATAALVQVDSGATDEFRHGTAGWRDTVSLTDADAIATKNDGIPEERMPFLERLFLRKLQKGDARAFRELVRRHESKVYSLSLRMLGDSAEAEDVSQEVFVAVHRHLPRFRGDCKLSTWIYRVTRNQCLNRIKYLEHRATDGEPDTDRTDAALAAASGEHLAMPAPRPDKALLGAEERAAVQTAMQKLSAEHRMLVVLRDIEGLDYDEIARVLELPIGTVKSRLHRARAHLADLLADAGMVPDGAEDTA